jgi:hypothetical protein
MLPFPSGRSWKRGAYAAYFATGFAGLQRFRRAAGESDGGNSNAEVVIQRE